MSAQPPPSAPKGNAFHIALTRVGGIVVLLGLSLATWAYRHALEPQYGTAPTSLHMGKIVWLAAILGSFAPTVPLSSAALALAVLLYALPSATYYVAAYTANFGDPVWGPVATHLVVLLPVLSLGIAIVKALQESTRNANEENSAPQSTITLPVCATAINSLQGLWPSVSYVAVLPDSQVFIYLATVCAALWSIGPFLPDVTPPPSPLVAAPIAAASTPETKSKRKKGSTTKSVPPAEPVAPPPLPKHYAKKSTGLGKLRVAVLPILALPILNEKILRAPILPHPLLEPFNHPSYPLQILYSVDSQYSGVVVVGETKPASPDEAGEIDHLRYLRAGHSLLGGVWVGPRALAEDENLLLEDEAGNKLGDSVYSAFVVQEAALLAAKKDPKNALIIGLGTGIAANSFMRQGIPTTLVEIDPAVYDAAKRFFGLAAPPPDRLFLEDARGWVHNTSAALKSGQTDIERFDIVVHDCFSGGTVPAHLFTKQFWKLMKDIVTPDAIIAVNFAGKLGSDSAKAIILTLRSVFPQCRALYDYLDDPNKPDDEFVNWVFFCTPSSEPLKFREATTSAYLGSYMRQHILSSIGEREVDISTVGADLEEDKKERYILKDMANPLSDWQDKEAIGHWKIMRHVMPKEMWETY